MTIIKHITYFDNIQTNIKSQAKRQTNIKRPERTNINVRSESKIDIKNLIMLRNFYIFHESLIMYLIYFFLLN